MSIEAVKDGAVYVATAGTGVMWITSVTPWVTALAGLATLVYTCLRIHDWFKNRRLDK